MEVPSILVILILSNTFYIVANRRATTQVRALSTQGLALSLLCLWLGRETGSSHLLVAGILTAAVKAIALPSVLLYIIRRLQVKWEREMYLSVPASLQVSMALAFIAYYLSGRLATATGALNRATLPVALALLFIGLFLMVSRRLALLQVIGLLIAENGLFLAALSATGGMPLPVELGIAFDVLVAGIIMGVLMHRIGVTFDSIDTEQLRLLKD